MSMALGVPSMVPPRFIQQERGGTHATVLGCLKHSVAEMSLRIAGCSWTRGLVEPSMIQAKPSMVGVVPSTEELVPIMALYCQTLCKLLCAQTQTLGMAV